jgi:hypothetical protein
MRRLLGRRGRDFDPKLTDLLIDIVRRLGSEHDDLKAYLSSEADDIEYFAAQRALRRATSGISERGGCHRDGALSPVVQAGGGQ